MLEEYEERVETIRQKKVDCCYGVMQPDVNDYVRDVSFLLELVDENEARELHAHVEACLRDK